MTIETAQKIVEALKDQGINAVVEYQFIGIGLSDGRYIAFGDVNEFWNGDVYANDDFGVPSDVINTDIPSAECDAQTIASAVKRAIDTL